MAKRAETYEIPFIRLSYMLVNDTSDFLGEIVHVYSLEF